MSNLHKYPTKFDPIPVLLNQCGLLFLSTPHLGSKLADWNKFSVWFGEVVFGIRENIVESLKSFNLSIVDTTQTWKEMPHKPVIRCLCEANDTQIGHIMRNEVVSLPSAGFLDQVAIKVPGTDHHTICKFRGSSEISFVLIKGSLESIKRELDIRRTEVPNVGRDIV